MEFDWLLGWLLRITSSTSSKARPAILQLRSKSDMAVSVADIGATPSTNCRSGLLYKGQMRLSSRMRPGQRTAYGRAAEASRPAEGHTILSQL